MTEGETKGSLPQQGASGSCFSRELAARLMSMASWAARSCLGASAATHKGEDSASGDDAFPGFRIPGLRTRRTTQYLLPIELGASVMTRTTMGHD